MERSGSCRQIREIGGLDGELVRFDGARHFDVLPLLVATDGASPPLVTTGDAYVRTS